MLIRQKDNVSQTKKDKAEKYQVARDEKLSKAEEERILKPSASRTYYVSHRNISTFSIFLISRSPKFKRQHSEDMNPRQQSWPRAGRREPIPPPNEQRNTYHLDRVLNAPRISPIPGRHSGDTAPNSFSSGETLDTQVQDMTSSYGSHSGSEYDDSTFCAYAYSSESSGEISDIGSDRYSDVAPKDIQPLPLQGSAVYNPFRWIVLMYILFASEHRQQPPAPRVAKVHRQLSLTNNVVRIVMCAATLCLLHYGAFLIVQAALDFFVTEPIHPSLGVVPMVLGFLFGAFEKYLRPNEALEYAIAFHTRWILLVIVVLSLALPSYLAVLGVIGLWFLWIVLKYVGRLLWGEVRPSSIWEDVQYTSAQVMWLVGLFWAMIRWVSNIVWKAFRYVCARIVGIPLLVWKEFEKTCSQVITDIRHPVQFLRRISPILSHLGLAVVVAYASSWCLMRTQVWTARDAIWSSRAESKETIRSLLSLSPRTASWMYEWVPIECRDRARWLAPGISPTYHHNRLLGLDEKHPAYVDAICHWIWADTPS